MTNYTFVLDADGKKLAPTKEQKAWFLIRKKHAALVSKYPMVIQLKKKISEKEICKDEICCGIDDGGLHVGIALVQKCQTRNKVVFKGTIEQRNDVKHLMEVRRGYRRYHRYHKRYRQARFNNRGSSKREGRIAPSILQKRQATIRVINQLNKWICEIKEWTIKPMRRQSKAKANNVLGIKHRDLVEYIFRNGEIHRGYVTALYPEQNALNFQSPTKHCKKVNAKKCKLLWKYSKIYWLENVS